LNERADQSKHAEPFVISASRRTDIPAFYLDWFRDRLKKRTFLIYNPYTQKRRVVRFEPGTVHSIVFWSKNFAPLLSGRSAFKEYNLFFNFTLNTENALLEPGVPPLADRLKQAGEIAHIYGPETIHWRFDPIVFWEAGGRRFDNLDDFDRISGYMAAAGVKRCYVSFMDRYAKIDRRERAMDDFTFIYPSPDRMAEEARRLQRRLSDLGMTLYTCCEKALLARLEGGGVRQGRCIDVPLLQEIYGGRMKAAPDYGQRRKAGCGCFRSVDVGSYRDQPCRHNCLYCYANPSSIFL
jgi:hypothetical protein